MSIVHHYPLALILSPFVASLALAQKVPDLRLNTGVPPGAATAQDPQIAASGNAVYAVWEDVRNGNSDVYFNRSQDAGATWLATDIRLDTNTVPGTSHSFDPRISAVGSSVYVVWYEDPITTADSPPDYDVYLNLSVDAGTSWLPTVRRVDHAPPGRASYNPAIAAEGTSVFVVWQDDRNGPSFQEDVYFNGSLDSGSTWLAQDVRLDLADAPGASDSKVPQIAVSGGRVYVVWEDYRLCVCSNPFAIFFNRSLDAGATWLPRDVRVDTGVPDGYSRSPQIEASGTSVYVTWQDERNFSLAPTFSDIYFNRSLDGGVTWLNPDLRLNTGVSPGSTQTDTPEIAAAGSSVYVVWSDSRTGPSYDIYFNRSLDSGSTWFATDVRLDTGSPPGAYGSFWPTIAASGNLVAVAWFDQAPLGASSDIHFNRSSDAGSSWLSSSMRLDTGDAVGAHSSMQPDLALGSTGTYVAWMDGRNNPFTTDIYFNLAFGIQPYGAGTAGTGGVAPVLSGSGTPVIGASISVDLTQGLGGVPGFLLLGWSGQASIPLLGGVLLVQPPLLPLPVTLSGTPGTPGAGSASLPLTLPNNANLIGLPLDFQAMLLDPGASSGVSMTNGVETWVG